MKIPHLKAVLLILTIFASFLLVLALLPQPNYTDGFKTIGDLQAYAATLNEFEKSENEHVLFPIYESYYHQKFEITLGKTIKNKIHGLFVNLGLSNPPTFSFSFFRNILESTTQFREKEGWTGKFIQKIEIDNTSKIVVFGTIQGSFHPLTRYLTKLQELGIIDENLKLINMHYYLIFLGNAVNRSPHGLETFALILRLLQQNPHNVIYLKGTNETSDLWKGNTLGRELELCTPPLLINKNNLIDKTTTFFNTLPLTLYCSTSSFTETTKDFFKITPCIDIPNLKMMLDEDLYKDFLISKNLKPLETFYLQKKPQIAEQISQEISLKAIITDIKKRDNYATTDGLRLLSPIKGIISWTVFSSSAEVIRNALKFFYDAFVIVTPAEKSSDWKITLYNRDVRNTQDPTFHTTQYYFFTGEKCS